jgi:hypothetical protein
MLKSNTTFRGSRDFTYMSYNHRYIIKAISSKEQKFIIKSLKKYLEYRISNPSSLLSKLYGVYTLTLEGSFYRMIILENLFYATLEYPLYYDFNCASSITSQEASTETLNRKSLKRYNVRKSTALMLKSERMIICSDDKERLILLIEKDIEFLEMIGSVGYYIRLGVFRRVPEDTICFKASEEDKYFIMGFIDYFQDLSMTRKMRNIIAECCKSRRFVVKNAGQYRTRMRDFLFDVLNLS